MLSVVVHAALITAWVAATMPSASMPSDSFANRIYYIPPPDRPPPLQGNGETVRYLTLAPGEGAGSGPGPSDLDARRPITPVAQQSAQAGEPQKADTVASTPSSAGVPNADSVFTILEVDTAVVRSQTSAAPAYPVDLLTKKIEGMVIARYIVDTTGFADTASFEVVRSTHPGFIAAVREALPYMRFSPAKIGSMRVRQLVEQPFTFKITPPAK
jgi:outer membrane biosynthesis protein TonB